MRATAQIQAEAKELWTQLGARMHAFERERAGLIARLDELDAEMRDAIADEDPVALRGRVAALETKLKELGE